MSYFDYCTGLTHDQRQVRRAVRRSGARARRTADPVPHGHCRLDPGGHRRGRAARRTRALARAKRARNLCLAGGVALNCVANGKVLRDGAFNDIWIQPAAGDAGGALGAALAAYHHVHRPARARSTAARDAMEGAYLGPSFEQAEIEQRLDGGGRAFTTVLTTTQLIETTAQALGRRQGGRLVPGAHGVRPTRARRRSILGDPRSPTMQKTLNLKVKYRESFRPFAPSVLREDVADWFELDGDSPYMLLVADVAKAAARAMTEEENALFGIDKLNVPRSEIPAVTHVDYSARIQTVHAETNPRYHALISAFQGADRLPGAGQHQLQRARRADRLHAGGRVPLLHGHDIEILVVGNCLLRKEEQDPALKLDYKAVRAGLRRGRISVARMKPGGSVLPHSAIAHEDGRKRPYAGYSAACRASDRLSSDEMMCSASASASGERSCGLRTSPTRQDGSSGKPSAGPSTRMPGRRPIWETPTPRARTGPRRRSRLRSAGVEDAVRPPDLSPGSHGGAPPAARRPAERQRQRLLRVGGMAVRRHPQQPLLAKDLGRAGVPQSVTMARSRSLLLIRSIRSTDGSHITVNSTRRIGAGRSAP